MIVHHLPYYARAKSHTRSGAAWHLWSSQWLIIADCRVHTAVRAALLEALAIVYGGSSLHWGLGTQWGRLFATWASFGQWHGQVQGQPGRHLMAALLGCDRVVA